MSKTSYNVITYDKDTKEIDLNATGVKKAIDSITGVGNGVNVVDAFNTRHDSLHLRVANTATASHTVTLKAGEYPNYILGDQIS